MNTVIQLALAPRTCSSYLSYFNCKVNVFVSVLAVPSTNFPFPYPRLHLVETWKNEMSKREDALGEAARKMTQLEKENASLRKELEELRAKGHKRGMETNSDEENSTGSKNRAKRKFLPLEQIIVPVLSMAVDAAAWAMKIKQVAENYDATDDDMKVLILARVEDQVRKDLEVVVLEGDWWALLDVVTGHYPQQRMRSETEIQRATGEAMATFLARFDCTLKANGINFV